MSGTYKIKYSNQHGVDLGEDVIHAQDAEDAISMWKAKHCPLTTHSSWWPVITHMEMVRPGFPEDFREWVDAQIKEANLYIDKNGVNTRMWIGKRNAYVAVQEKLGISSEGPEAGSDL